MATIYLAMMGNGSEELMLRGVSTTPKGTLEHLQRDFLEWVTEGPYGADDERLDDVKDKTAPTLDEDG